MQLGDFLKLFNQNELTEFCRRTSPENYEAFVQQIHSDIFDIVNLIEADSKDYLSRSEDEINRDIVRNLKSKNYNASHDTDENGHVDIHIISRNNRYTWLAEAKIYNGPSYIEDGVDQLTTRYARGTEGHNHGGILIYIKNSSCEDKFKAWRTHFSLLSDKYKNLAVQDNCRRSSMSFKSEHSLNRIGLSSANYNLLHIGISIYREASSN